MNKGAFFPLDAVCEVEYGTRVVQKRDGGSAYPVYGGGGATFKLDSFNREDRLVVSRFGMSEECVRFVRGKFFLNDSGLTVSSKDDRLLPRFLDYQILSKSEEIFLLGKGAAQKNLDVPAFRALQVFVPTDIDTQRRIVAILDEAFDGIATAERNAERNVQNARALFESQLQAAFLEQGAGWTMKHLGEIATFRNGINFTKTSEGNPIKILGVKDFKNNYWAPMDELETIIPNGQVPDSDTVQKGDIVFVRSNGNPVLIGRCLLIGEVRERTTHSGFTIKARLRTNEVSPTYLCHFLRSDRTRREMIDGGNGVNIKSLNQGTLSRIAVPFPSVKDQIRIVQRLEEIQGEVQRLESLCHRKLTAINDLKMSLLHEAFTGQL